MCVPPVPWADNELLTDTFLTDSYHISCRMYAVSILPTVSIHSICPPSSSYTGANHRNMWDGVDVKPVTRTMQYVIRNERLTRRSPRCWLQSPRQEHSSTAGWPRARSCRGPRLGRSGTPGARRSSSATLPRPGSVRPLLLCPCRRAHSCVLGREGGRTSWADDGQ